MKKLQKIEIAYLLGGNDDYLSNQFIPVGNTSDIEFVRIRATVSIRTSKRGRK